MRKQLLAAVAMGILLLVGCSKKEVCTVDGCAQEVYKNGYCVDHYIPVELKITQRVPDIFCNGDDKQIDDNWVYIASTDIDVGKITWNSSDDSVLHISDDGELECVKNGVATLTVTSEDGGSDSKEIQCYTSRATDLDFPDYLVDLKVKDKYKMEPIFDPIDGYGEVEYKVSLDKYKPYISVSSDGTVRAKAATHGDYVSVDAYLVSQKGEKPYASVLFRITDDYYHETGIVPITLTNSYYYIDSVGGVEVYFNFKNNTDRKIKYIDFSVDLYNAVGDKIRDTITGSSSYAVEYTGPLEAGASTGDFTRMNKFYNPNYSGRLKFTDVTITYMDGTTEDIPSVMLLNSQFWPDM